MLAFHAYARVKVAHDVPHGGTTSPVAFIAYQGTCGLHMFHAGADRMHW